MPLIGNFASFQVRLRYRSHIPCYEWSFFARNPPKYVQFTSYVDVLTGWYFWKTIDIWYFGKKSKRKFTFKVFSRKNLGLFSKPNKNTFYYLFKTKIHSRRGGDEAGWGHAHPLPPLERECFRRNRRFGSEFVLVLYDSYKISLEDVIKVIKGKFLGCFSQKNVNISKKGRKKSTG